MERNIELLFEQFDKTSVDTQGKIQEMLSVVTSGKVPDTELVNDAVANIDSLRNTYNELLAYANAVSDKDSVPAIGDSISSIKESIENSEQALILERIKNAKDILDKFIRVRSDIDVYVTELKPYQEKAMNLVKSIESLSIDQVDAESEGAKVFIAALENDNPDSDYGYELICRAKNYFPERVVRGLDRDKYFISSDSSYYESTNKEENEVNNIEIKPDIETSLLEDALELQEDNVATEVSVPINDEYYYYPLNSSKNGMSKAVSFKRDIEKINNEVRGVIPLFTNLGILTLNQIIDFSLLFGGIKDNEKEIGGIEFAVNRLVDKGYVMKFGAENAEYYYCLSDYASSCMQKDSVKNAKSFWSYSIGRFFIDDASTKLPKKKADSIIQDNDYLYEYLKISKSLLNKKDYIKVQASFKRTKSVYDVDAIIDGNNYKAQLYKEGFNDPNKKIILLTALSGIPENLASDRLIICSESQLGLATEDNSANDESIDEVVHSKVESENGQTVQEFEEAEKLDKEPVEESARTEEKTEPQSVVMPIVIPDPYNDNHLIDDVPSEDFFLEIIDNLLSAKKENMDDIRSSVVDCVVLARAVSFIPQYNRVSHIYQQLLLATDIPLQERKYSDLALLDAFQDPSNDNKCIMISAYMFALLVPWRAYDYGISSQSDLFLHNFSEYFDGLEVVKPLFNKLTKVSASLPDGFTPSTVALLGNEEKNSKYISSLKSKASELLVTPKVKTRMKNLQPMYYSLFGQGSSLYECLEIVYNNRIADIDLVKITLSDYCTEEQGLFSLDETKLEDQVNEAWYKVNPGNKFELDYDAKDRVIKHTSNRVKVLMDWYKMESQLINKDLELSRIKSLKSELISEAQKAYELSQNLDLKGINVLKWMLHHIIDYLDGSVDNAWIFNDFLLSGLFSLDSDYIPIINRDFNLIKYYEPWRNLKKHIESSVSTFQDARKNILEDEESIMFDNINQLKLIDSIIKSENVYAEDEVRASADRIKAEFEEEIELAYTYSQISESEKEKLVQLVKQHQEFFYENGDFGCWKQFLDALREQVRELTKSKKENLENALANILNSFSGNPPSILLEAQKLLESGEELNLAVVEEYINRYAAGETELIDNYKISENDEDIFSAFYESDTFNSIIEECKNGKNRRFSDFAPGYVASHAPDGWVSKHKDASKEFLRNWPTNRNGDTTKVKSFFSDLGFVVDKVGSVGIKNGNICRYKLYVKPDKQGKQEYNHPIAAFGTQMKSPIDVIVLLGTSTPSQIVNTVKELDLSALSIVILDKPFGLSERRTMCETYHTRTSQQNPFILIDQALCLYLALHQKEERLPLLLMSTLPFTTYQPFVRDGGSTSDEMFCGRITELRSIMDKNGASVVYGGRQLGKTALLERAAKRCNVPEQKLFAVYISIYDCDSEEKFVKKAVKEINKKSFDSINIRETCTSIEVLCDEIEKLFNSEKVHELKLFIDEADKFLNSIANGNYEKLQPLIDLRRNTTNNFKFVLAGLHNVCRAQKATENNGVFGQLGQPLCVKPLSPKDAIELISKPLRYLGFQIDRFPHLETILTTTNYYPGILQFFGYTLVETLTSNYKSYYQAENNPPFPLQKEQLASVINSTDLNESIKEKFKLSLKLDPRYFMLARCIAYRYHYENNNNRWMGYSIDEIKEVADSYPIHCLEGLTKIEYKNLLNEMVEMGILSPENDSYRLRKASFIDVIGRDWDKVDEEILSDNG